MSQLQQEEARLEWQISEWSQHWRSTSYSRELTTLVSRIISDRAGSPISNVVVLAIGSSDNNPSRLYARQRDIQQFVVFEQIAARLATAYPDLPKNTVAQDPCMKPEWQAAFENRGIPIVKNPTAFGFVGRDTFLVAPSMGPVVMAMGVPAEPGEFGVFFGDGEILAADAMRDPRAPEFANWVDRGVIRSMFNEKACKHEDVPCHRPRGKVSPRTLTDGTMQGLAMMDIWWRPVIKNQ